ncbi:TetR/AcrR family transcriptional regulator [Fulvivirga lutea]|uniref:TetR/AcrR family transcriptional regulator n=1 Tax=Fulvivirga lutea TaxID=2810512 RepID=A0A974WG18_9BACT|nr:TetR family transcriptional regulator C-terminal domain-containing protein [Fulvivirga lutea]QSE96923.1 TetR/AcrR family transcriptional regulator [Fulvivirga lutea]
MAKQATKKKTAPRVNTQQKIVKAYKDHLLRNGSKPASVYQFTADLGLDEIEFYKYFPSFEVIDNEIWSEMIIHTIQSIKSDKVFEEYGAREKMLSFYYTLIEVLKKDRSYVKMTFKRSNKPEFVPAQLKGFKAEFDMFCKEIISEGQDSEEIVRRPYISDRYHDGLWLQLVFIISFWLRDTSKDFERTDAAIEKSANLSFELMGRGPLDMIVDFGKFLYQNK